MGEVAIAVSCAIAVVKQAGSALGNVSVQEGSRLFKLKEDLEWIEAMMRYVQDYLEDADESYEQGRGRLEASLLRNITVLAYDVEDIVEKYFPQIASQLSQEGDGCLGWLRCATSILLNCKTAWDCAREIEGIKKRVEDIKTFRQAFPIIARSSRDRGDTWDPRRHFPHTDDDAIVIGLDEHIKVLEAKVLDKDSRHHAIFITGLPGLGKTTLAKKVYNSVKREFECSAWIFVTQQPNIKELLQDIAQEVGLEEEKRIHHVEANLFEFLRQKRYVIVIDDIWKIESWNSLKIGIPVKSEKGSRIIITSRYKDLYADIGVHIEQVGGQRFLHDLKPLDQKNSRELFDKMIGNPPKNNDENREPSELENIGDQILKRCGGVPLAIAVTVGILLSKERTIWDWKKVLKRMGQHGDEYTRIFALSYEDLPTKLKPCFLYLGLFPEDHEIVAFQLINLWAAEKFIQGSDRIEVEDVGDEYLNCFVARNLIQVVRRSLDGRVDRCRIHDIFHNICTQVAKKIDFFNTLDDVTTSRVRRLTTHVRDFGDYISLNHKTPKLRALLCFRAEKEKLLNWIQNPVEDFKFIRVLSVQFDIYSNSPLNEIGIFNSLSYFRVERLNVLVLPYTISNLKNLQTLDVRSCLEVIIPNVIWNMKQLRHIMLPLNCMGPEAPPASPFCGVNSDCFQPSEISLPNLQRLHWFPIKVFGAARLHELTNLRTLGFSHVTQLILEVLSDETLTISHMLEELWLVEGLRFVGEDRGFSSLFNLSHYENLHILFLDMTLMEFPKYDKLPPNLTVLFLRSTFLQEDPMETLKELRELRILEFGPSSYIGKQMVCSGEADKFPQLEVLKIHYLEDLEELKIEEGGMPKLKDFTLMGCRPAMEIPVRIRNIITFPPSPR